MKTMELRFDTTMTCIEAPGPMDGEEALERALALELRSLRLDWDGLMKVGLPVEDDLLFLVMAYEELEDCLASGRAHDVFLGDGLFVVTAVRDGQGMAVELCHTPHLDKRFSKSQFVKVDVERYRNAWRGLMRQIAEQLGPA